MECLLAEETFVVLLTFGNLGIFEVFIVFLFLFLMF